MEVSTITGATPRNYIELRAETLTECADLVACSQSKFIGEDSTALLVGYRKDGRTLYLRIFVGPENRSDIDAATLATLDATP